MGGGLTVLATVLGLAASGTLLAAGVTHARDGGRLATALRLQGRVPPRLAAPAAHLVTAAELVLAAVGLAALATATTPTATRVTLLSAAGLLGAYAAYMWDLLRRGSAAPCGCAGDDHPLNAATLFRAAALAVCALVGATSDTGLAVSGRNLSLTLTAAGGLATALWVLPGALHDPRAAARR